MTKEQEDRILYELGRINQNIKQVEQSITIQDNHFTKLEHRIFGNGQPGEIQLAQNEIKALTEFSNRAKGVLAVLTFMGVGSMLRIFKVI